MLLYYIFFIISLKFVHSETEQVNCCSCLESATDDIKQEAQKLEIGFQCSNGYSKVKNSSEKSELEQKLGYIVDSIDFPTLIGMLCAIARNESTYIEHWNRHTLELDNITFWQVVSYFQSNFLSSFESVAKSGKRFKDQLDNTMITLNRIPLLLQQEDYANLTAELQKVEEFQAEFERFKADIEEESFNHELGLKSDMIGLKLKTRMNLLKSQSEIKSLESYQYYSDSTNRGLRMNWKKLQQIDQYYESKYTRARYEFRKKTIETNHIFFLGNVKRQTPNYSAIYEKVISEYFDNLEAGFDFHSPEYLVCWEAMTMVNAYLDVVKQLTTNDSNIEEAEQENVFVMVGMCPSTMRLGLDTLKKQWSHSNSSTTIGVTVLSETHNVCSDLEALKNAIVDNDEKIKDELQKKINTHQILIMGYLTELSMQNDRKNGDTFNKGKILKHGMGMDVEEFKMQMYDAIRTDVKIKLGTINEAILSNKQSAQNVKQALTKEMETKAALERLYQKTLQTICLANKITVKASGAKSFLHHVTHIFDKHSRRGLEDLNQTSFMLMDPLTQKNFYTKIFLLNKALTYVKLVNYTLTENGLLLESYLNVSEKYITTPLEIMKFQFASLDFSNLIVQRSLMKLYFIYCQNVTSIKEQVTEMLRVKDEEFVQSTNNTKPEEEVDTLFALFEL